MQAQIDWKYAQKELLEKGFVKLEKLVSANTCNMVMSAYDDDIYRSTINMARYNFGRGQYKYFAYPLPDMISTLRRYFYSHLRPVATEWSARLKLDDDYPQDHDDYLKICHAHDQLRPTQLILKYAKDDYNALHQDLYGDIHFPYQAAVMLSDENNYTGGDFTLIEQRPRMQSVAHVQTLNQGDAIIFAVNEFPKQGKRGYYRSKLRHGVSKVRSGHRQTLGIILHDAK
ncbi:MAG: 2OG-Fe(II) oxygenase [Emcibacteraceae bacterium]|nr:2OG-Fe(II) oxygenase [Emcibacteraceae bacterium]